MGVDQRRGSNCVKLRRVLLMAVLSFSVQYPSFSWCLNTEGLALLSFRERIEGDPFGALSGWSEEDVNPCLWSGVACTDGKVVNLNFRDLCLQGTLAPEIRQLAHLKSVVLRNNSFFGSIPKEVAGLPELELLDLGYNYLTGPIPSEFNLSFTRVLLDNNEFLCSISQNLHAKINAASLEASCPIRCPWDKNSEQGDNTNRRLLQLNPPDGVQAAAPAPFSPTVKDPRPPTAKSPSSTPPPPTSATDRRVPPPVPPPQPSIFPAGPQTSPQLPQPPPKLRPPNSPQPPTTTSRPPAPPEAGGDSKQLVSGIIGGVGALLVVVVAVLGIIFFRNRKVRPWATGISGQLQKAFVTGVPKLKRSELEAACEDFSNIIGSFPGGTIYKGTLSSGAEIAVTSTPIKSIHDWSESLETQFREKIEQLSRVNHKNFLNLIGYCQEIEPFTRMMVFEYAPNGSLFEHLHVQEAEHLDWNVRLRIAMGITYCLEHMHRLSPPFLLKSLRSCSVYLTEDNAPKIVDFTYRCNGPSSWSSDHQAPPNPADPPSNVYSFGVILYEILTGRMPNSVEYRSLADLLSVYTRRERPLQKLVDPTLQVYQEDVLGRLIEVIRTCVNPDPRERPTMAEVSTKLREITGMGPDAAMPRLSPSWWAELEIVSDAM